MRKSSELAIAPSNARKDRGVNAPKHGYKLAELLAQCDSKAPPLADIALWDNAEPVGQEAW